MVLESFRFTGRIPTFTLFAKSIGGPPDARWERNGQIIRTDHPSFTMSYELNRLVHDYYRRAPYNFTLIAHGFLPGEYVFVVSNRRTDRVFRISAVVEGIYSMFMGSAGNRGIIQ